MIKDIVQIVRSEVSEDSANCSFRNEVKGEGPMNLEFEIKKGKQFEKKVLCIFKYHIISHI